MEVGAQLTPSQAEETQRWWVPADRRNGLQDEEEDG